MRKELGSVSSSCFSCEIWDCTSIFFVFCFGGILGSAQSLLLEDFRGPCGILGFKTSLAACKAIALPYCIIALAALLLFSISIFQFYPVPPFASLWLWWAGATYAYLWCSPEVTHFIAVLMFIHMLASVLSSPEAVRAVVLCTFWSGGSMGHLCACWHFYFSCVTPYI